MTRIHTLLTASLALTSLSGCFLVPPELLVATEDTIKIGVMAPTSGTNAEKGESVYNGAQLAIEELNAAGGVLGKRLSLVKSDDQSDAKKAPAKAARVLDQGVVAIIGNVQSSVTQAVLLEQAKLKGCVMISPGSTSPNFSDPAKIDDGGWFFRTIPSDALQGKAIAQRALDAGYRTIGIVNVDNVYGNGLAAVLKASFEAVPGHTAIQTIYSEEPTPKPSYSDVIGPILEIGPDAIALIGYPGGCSQIYKDWITSGLKPEMPWLFSEALKADSFVANVNASDRLEGKTGTAPFSGGERYTRFVKTYETRFKLPPGLYAENAYDAAVLVAFALQRAGEPSRVAVRDHLQEVSAGGLQVEPGTEGLKAGLAALKAGQDIDYVGISGPVDLDDRGDVTTGTYAVWQVKGGAIQLTGQVLTP
jgi:branched-chain amino acid transport system substrate-binding protein